MKTEIDFVFVSDGTPSATVWSKRVFVAFRTAALVDMCAFASSMASSVFSIGTVLLLAMCMLAKAPSVNYDRRLMELRPGYGVNFDKIGMIADSSSVLYYSATWLLKIPRLEAPSYKLVRCEPFTDLTTAAERTASNIWMRRCRYINELVGAGNTYAFRRAAYAQQSLDRMLAMIPLLFNETMDWAELYNTTDEGVGIINRTKSGDQIGDIPARPVGF